MMNKLRRKLLLSFLTIFFITGLTVANPYSQGLSSADKLFSDATSSLTDALQMKQAQERRDPKVVRSHYVRVNFDSLEGAESIVLNLFGNVSKTAVRERAERRSESRYSWFARIDEMEDSSAVLTVEDGDMAGNITIDGKLYQVRPAGSGIHSIREIDQSAFPQEDCAPPIETQDPEGFDSQTLLPTQERADDATFIDVMVVYTQDAANASFNIGAEIQLAVDETNQSYISSGINPRIRLVHTAQVTYSETGNISEDVSRLKNPSDGYMDQVHTLRNLYGADMVALIVENGGAYCGIAYAIMSTVSTSFEDRAFCVVARDCATGYYSFGHELGHLQSARHDWSVDPTDISPFTYNHGYVSPMLNWRTVMAYGNACYGCTRLQYWSNPDVSYSGTPMGIPEGQFQAADNRKTLNATALTVANFRQSGQPSFVDVPPGFWAEDYINAIFNAGITQGCSSTPMKYCPQDDVTRDQMAAFIVRALEGEPPADYCDTGSPFSDVSPASGFCKYIKRLSELEITQGCGPGIYCPEAAVTRDQMAAFIVRALEGDLPADYCDTGSPFSDVSPASGFCKYIKRLSELEITQGCGPGIYCPKTTVTRDQMAAFLARAFLGMD